MRARFALVFPLILVIALFLFVLTSIWHALQNLWFGRPFRDEL